MRIAFLSFLFLGMLAGQAQTPAQKLRTDQLQFQQERKQLLDLAKAAFDREMAREKAGDCRNANSTHETNECLGTEIETSTVNYKAYVGALRAMLIQRNPWSKAAEERGGSSTGQSLNQQNLVIAFDQMEVDWGKYREAMCAGASELYKGGTIVNAISYSCELMMVRSHMRELAGIYIEFFSR